VIAVLAGLAAAVAIAGVGVIVLGLFGGGGATRSPSATQSSRFDAVDPRRWWRGLTPARRRWIAGGLIAGAVVMAITRWAPALVIIPLIVAVAPGLLGDPKNRDIEVLEALDRWVRALTASLLTGRSVPDAIRSTRRQAPETLAAAVTLLAARLDERWPLPDALAAFADDVNHPEADAVAAALIVAGQRGTGAAATLEALADALQDRLSAARDIDNERAKPRIVVRQVTAIIAVVLVLALITSPKYFEPYRHGAGPLLAVALMLVYILALARLQAASRPPVRARLRIVPRQVRQGTLSEGGVR